VGIIAEALKGGGSFLKWAETPGTTYTGVITDVTLRQARKFESTELDFWDDMSPKMQVVLTLQTEYRDDSNADDDGQRQVAINLWSGQKKALVAACKAAGVAEPEVGQKFTVTHLSGVGTAKSPRVFQYTLAAGPSPAAALLAVADQIVAHEVSAVEVPSVTVAASPVDLARQLLTAGLSTAEVATASGLPEPTVAALKNTL
jgi:hypothetical protein